ncbi:MAG: VWA domain-containing protein [Acidobacteria bacterium]|nr:VWA domain-containing protein [Acidobacteriota bacterium]
MNRALTFLALAGVLPAAAGGLTPGMLARLDANGNAELPCPLEHTAVTVEAQGPVARVKVRQLFRNPSSDPMEAIYTFPLAASGAVDAMTIRIGDRVVKGSIKRREEARAIYEAARRQGKLAGLLDQQRPNVFVQSVTNIPPNAKVEVEIEYVEALKFEAGRYEFVFPMVVGPRYSPKHDPNAMTNPVYAPQGVRAGHDISLSMKIDSGLPISGIDSTTHEVITENHNTWATARLRNGKEIPNKDFILRWDITGRKMSDTLLTHRGPDGKGFFSFVLAPPDAPSRNETTPKELVFVVDTSGSMHGFPLDKAKESMFAALDGLNPGDTFNLITFAGDTHVLFPAPVAATHENIATARQFLAGRRGAGGTEMMKAIHAAFTPSGAADHLRVICFMTDGYVGNEAEILSEIRRHPEARVFGFGIGTSVNRHLLDQMSLQGRGEVEYVSLQDDGSAAAKRFYERVRTPLLTGISVEFDGLNVEDVYPSRVPDLFSAKPVVITGRFSAAMRGKLVLRGKLGGRPYERVVNVEFPEQASRAALRTLWARTKVAELSAEGEAQHRESITQLGLEFSLMTSFTSFIAVEEKTISEGGRLRTVEVPVEVPEGVDGRMAGAGFRSRSALAGVGGWVPMAAAPQSAYSRDEAKRTLAEPQPSISVDLRAKTASADFVEVRVYLKDASAATIEKLKKAGLQVIAQPGGARLVIGRIAGNQLQALSELPEVTLVAPR